MTEQGTVRGNVGPTGLDGEVEGGNGGNDENDDEGADGQGNERRSDAAVANTSR